MVNNFTRINKPGNYISPQIIEYKKRPLPIPMEYQILAWDSHKSIRIKMLMESLLIIGSPSTMQI
jgi:hypothetical protein